MRGTAGAVVLTLALTLACSRTTELLPAPVAPCVAPIRIGGTDAQRCFGRYALCSCNELSVSGNLTVVGSPPGGPKGPGPGAPAPLAFKAAVGTDGNLRVMGLTEVEGSLVTAGSGLATFVRGGHIQGNLRGGGSFTTMTTMGVWVSGEMSSAGDVSGLFKVVGGPLRVPAGAAVAMPDVQASGGLVRQPVGVASPCGCGPGTEVAAAVEERRTRNSNANVFAVGDLAEIETSVTIDVPCGEFYLSEIRAADTAAVELRVHGRAAIFVAGDVRFGNNFIVTLVDDAELDLVVARDLYTKGLVFGSPSSPARMRLWIGGVTASLPDQVQFGAAVYAPRAVFSAGTNVQFFGSLYVGTLLVAGGVNISYDPMIAQSGAFCGVSAQPPLD